MKAVATSVVNAASVQSAANEVAVMAAAVAVAVVVNALKAALSGLANAVLSAAKAALTHVANAAQKVVLRVVRNVLKPKAVVKAAVKVVAAQNAPAKLAQTCVPKAALRASPAAKVNPAAKAVVTAIAAIVPNAQSAPAHPATRPKKNWHSPIRLPWPPLLAVM